jgi:uncharacterized phage protein (TIGR02218 family)
MSADWGAAGAQALSCVAFCWRIERRDGVAIELTTHDRDLTIDGLVHRAAPGMTPSAIERTAGLDADTMDVRGALTSAAIGEADLLAGRWDGARVRVFAVNWESGTALADFGEGRIGAVELGEDGFTAELAGTSAALDRPVVEETSAECRAELGDRRCRVAMAGRRRFARVVTVADRVVTLDAAEPVAGAYAGGVLRWFGRGERRAGAGDRRLGGGERDGAERAGLCGGGGGVGRSERGVRQEFRDLRGAVRQCGELPRRAASAGDRPADALSRWLRRRRRSPQRRWRWWGHRSGCTAASRRAGSIASGSSRRRCARRVGRAWCRAATRCAAAIRRR